MRTILVLVRKDFANFFRNKAAVSLTFLVPFALIWLFGLIFGINRKDTGPTGIPLAVVNASGDASAGKLVQALQAEKAFKVVTTTTAADGTERTTLKVLAFLVQPMGQIGKRRPYTGDGVRPAARQGEGRLTDWDVVQR